MTTEIKIQIVFAAFLALELLGLYMIIIRTVANMEYAFNRMEDIVSREVQLSLRSREQHRITQEKAQSADTRGKKNELLLNIPFMERLSKDKRKE
ncbi:MAG TPA: hypothetical protein VK465_12485 [Fibrobacteria bacterium]|nr:hypothetical protein [Fibrobacteria bacterium]